MNNFILVVGIGINVLRSSSEKEKSLDIKTEAMDEHGLSQKERIVLMHLSTNIHTLLEKISERSAA